MLGWALRSHWLQWHCWAAVAAAVMLTPTLLVAQFEAPFSIFEQQQQQQQQQQQRCAPSVVPNQAPDVGGTRTARSNALVAWANTLSQHVGSGLAGYFAQLACLLACMRLCDEHNPRAWDWRRFKPAVFVSLDAAQRLLSLLFQHVLPLAWGISWGLPRVLGLSATVLLAARWQYRGQQLGQRTT